VNGVRVSVAAARLPQSVRPSDSILIFSLCSQFLAAHPLRSLSQTRCKSSPTIVRLHRNGSLFLPSPDHRGPHMRQGAAMQAGPNGHEKSRGACGAVRRTTKSQLSYSQPGTISSREEGGKGGRCCRTSKCRADSSKQPLVASLGKLAPQREEVRLRECKEWE